MPKKNLERISLTIDKTLLDRLDGYVALNKSIKDTSRSGVVSELIRQYIPS